VVTTSADPAAAGRRQRPRDRKQQILVAARDLFVAHGYQNVSMAMIAEQVGITAGALYRHFANKTVLLERVIADSFGWLDEPIVHPDYETAVEETIALVLDRPYLSDLWIHETRHLPEAERHELRRRMSSWNESLKPALRSRRPDLDPGQEELLAWAVHSIAAAIGRQALHAPVSARIPAVRAALDALTSAELVPTGSAVDRPRRLFPASMRERLLLAAFEQFNENGFHDTSLASLGAAIDVTGPNLYSYYESKVDLLRAVLDRGSHALWLGLEQALSSSADPEEALTELCRSYVVMARSWASDVQDPRTEYGLAESVRAFRREYVGEWVALLKQARPLLSPNDARLRVQLALLMVADLYSNAELARLDSFPKNATALMLALLFQPGDDDGSDTADAAAGQR